MQRYDATTSGHDRFARLAATLSRRTAAIVDAPVVVLDGAGRVVACSGAAGDRDARRQPPIQPEDCSIRVPVRLHGRDGEVVVGLSADGEAIPARLVSAVIDWMTREGSALDGLPGRTELKSQFISNLLHGPARSPADVLREAEVLGMDLTRPRAVLLVDAAGAISDSGGLRPREIIATIVRFFHLPDDTICAYIGDGEVAVLKASSSQDLDAWTGTSSGQEPYPNPSWANLAALKRAARALLAVLSRETSAPLNIGVGRHHPGIHGLARSYQDARAALSLGRRFQGVNRVSCLDSLGVAAFVGVADERTKIELARHLLSPLDQEPDLLETLDVFFAEDCGVKTTVRRLAVHRNTLAYRMDKISSLVGLDPRRFDDAVQIRLALVMRELADGAG